MMALMPANCWKAKMRQLMTTDLVVRIFHTLGCFGAAALPGELARPAGESRPRISSQIEQDVGNGREVGTADVVQAHLEPTFAEQRWAGWAPQPDCRVLRLHVPVIGKQPPRALRHKQQTCTQGRAVNGSMCRPGRPMAASSERT